MPPPTSDANGDGTDGSSIKPVSSLLARFENLNKPLDPPQSAPSRPISPAPKPERLRDFKPSQDSAAPAPSPTVPVAPPKLKDIPRATTLPLGHDQEELPIRPPSTRPTLKSRSPPAAPQAPAVTVQPPQSPPKERAIAPNGGDQSPFLNPLPTSGFVTPTKGSPSSKLPGRSHTPTPSLPPPRSPRSSQPPSPPPPRRSGEIRRDREPKQPPPPPAPRTDKPLIPANRPAGSAEYQRPPAPRKRDVSQETSPFNSPPPSPDASDDEAPPQLPTRPRPQFERQGVPPRPKSTLGGFEPPPVHPTVVSKRRERDVDWNGPVKGSIPPQLTGDHGRVMVAPPVPADVASRSLPPEASRAPSRQPRAGASSSPPEGSDYPTRVQPKKISAGSSTPQLPLPPTKSHGRSKTMDGPAAQPVEDAHSIATAKPSEGAVAAISNTNGNSGGTVTSFPDGREINRRPPFIKKGCYEIVTRYDPRIFDTCGDYICTSGHLTRVWSIIDGELLMSLAHTEGIKATAVTFKPAADPQDEGSKIWIGTNNGEIMEVDIASQSITTSRGSVHNRLEVTRIYRHYNELWTLDEGGGLHVWGPDDDYVPNLGRNPTQSYKTPRGHTFSMVVGDELWHATGKEVRVFAPTADGRNQFQVLVRPLMADGAGDVTAGTLIKSRPGKVFLGHSDGKVSVWSTSDYSCSAVLSVSGWKISCLVGVGQQMWAAYNSGKICVYDMKTSPWVVKKEWQAHDNPIIKMKLDASSAYRLDRLQIISLGADNKIKIWDGLLQDDWTEDNMKSKEKQYCGFEEIKAMVFTWNAGASTPHSLRYSGNDANFFPDLLQSSGSPDILVFGFQELVDLEDKTATAKRFLKPKKKEGTDQERMSHQYRDWRDFLLKTLDDYMPADNLYHLLQSLPMVGLFTCVFVKSSLRDRIRNLSTAEVKRGMGGLHGNKGAVAIRFQVDDTSVCLVNCHLAAGQTQTQSRHNDIAAILESNIFPPERDGDTRIDTYTGGGDGTMILDHELCVLSGDLNYRIDTMSRDTVVMAVKQKNLSKLLDRDQLLVARRRNPAFRLRVFEELPITFPPTYKYDVGTTNYDTSEKRRSPAWCDRLLFRGGARVQQLDYRRHEVLVSDHRPVSGCFRLWVKTVNARDRATAWMKSQQAFDDVRLRELAEEKFLYLRDTCGYDEATSKQLANEKVAKRAR